MFKLPFTRQLHYIGELIYDFCLEFSDTIYFLDMVEQLLEYSDENKKEFDIVAAMGRHTCPVIW